MDLGLHIKLRKDFRVFLQLDPSLEQSEKTDKTSTFNQFTYIPLGKLLYLVKVEQIRLLISLIHSKAGSG
jgi:hypothetical protein